MADDKDVAKDIYFRSFERSDFEAFMALATDEKSYRCWESDDIISKEDDGLSYMVKVICTHPFIKAICLMDNDKVIGKFTVTPPVDEDEDTRCRAELRYKILPEYWGKGGITTKAVHMIVSDIFMEWPHLKRLEAVADVEDLASNRVLDKAGFRKDGVSRQYRIVEGNPRDFVMYSLLASDLPLLQLEHLCL